MPRDIANKQISPFKRNFNVKVKIRGKKGVSKRALKLLRWSKIAFFTNSMICFLYMYIMHLLLQGRGKLSDLICSIVEAMCSGILKTSKKAMIFAI